MPLLITRPSMPHNDEKGQGQLFASQHVISNPFMGEKSPDTEVAPQFSALQLRGFVTACLAHNQPFHASQ